MSIKRSEVLAVAAGTLLLAIGIVRLALPDRSRIRPLSIEAMEFPSEPILSHQGLERTRDWTAPDDVYLVGWGPRVFAVKSGAMLTLFLVAPTPTLLFEYQEDEFPSRNEHFAPGTGFLVRKGQVLRLRFRINNSGPDSQTHGARAALYFVPVAGN